MTAPIVLTIGVSSTEGLSSWCAARGLQLVETRNAAEGCDRAQMGGPALIIGQLSLAQLGELALYARLRELPASRGVPLLFVCAPAELAQCRNFTGPLGALDYLETPISPQALDRALSATPGPWPRPTTPSAAEQPPLVVRGRLTRAPDAEAVGGAGRGSSSPRLQSVAHPDAPSRAEIDQRLKVLGSQDTFERLGVPRTASDDTIRAAVAELERRYGEEALAGAPVSMQRAAETLRRAVSLAAETLLDPDKRATYMARLGGSPGSSAAIGRVSPREAAADHPSSDDLETLFREAEDATKKGAVASAVGEPALSPRMRRGAPPLDAAATQPASSLESARPLRAPADGEMFEFDLELPSAGRVGAAAAETVATAAPPPATRRDAQSLDAAAPASALPSGAAASAVAAAPTDTATATPPHTSPTAAAPQGDIAPIDDEALLVPTFDEVDDLFADDSNVSPAASPKRRAAPASSAAHSGWGAVSFASAPPAVQSGGLWGDMAAGNDAAAAPLVPATSPQDSTPRNQRSSLGSGRGGGVAGAEPSFSLSRLAAAALEEQAEQADPAETSAEEDAQEPAAVVEGQERARRDPAQALAPGPEDWFLQGRFYTLLGDHPRAQALLKAAVEAEPGQRRYQYWMELGRVRALAAAGNFDDARAQLERTKRLAAPGQTEVEELQDALSDKRKKGGSRLF